MAIELGSVIHAVISFAVHERYMVNWVIELCPTVSDNSLGQIMYNKVGVPKETTKGQSMKLQGLSLSCSGDIRILDMAGHPLRKAAEVSIRRG